MTRVAVVIPTLNEELAIGACLERVRAVAGGRPIDLIVCDGGSADATVAIAERAGAVVTSGPAGRGTQLRRGVDASHAEVLLFLHADTLLPLGAFAAIGAALARPGVVGGAFRLGFDDPRWRFRLVEGVARLRTAVIGRPWGDQALFCTRAAYHDSGGYPDWPILEDVEFSGRLRRQGQLVLLPQRVLTSARRYRSGGVLATVVRNQVMLLLFALGVAPQKLLRLYR